MPRTMRAAHSGTPRGSFAVELGAGGAKGAPIFDVVLKRITIRGSIVGTRQDLTEALAFASEGKVAAHINHARLEDVNDVFTALKAGRVDGRMVLDIGLPSQSRAVAHREVTA